MYDTDNYFYLHLTFDEDSGTCLTLLRAENRSYSYPAGILPVPADAPLLFKAAVDHDTIRFFYSLSDEQNSVSYTHLFIITAPPCVLECSAGLR